MDLNQNLNELMKQAQEMQQQMQAAQDALRQKKVTGTAANGLVKILLTCTHDVLKVAFTMPQEKLDAPLSASINMLQDLVAAAFNDGVRKIEAASKEKINDLASALNLPKDFLANKDKED